jgi:RNA polymerase sigma factor (TIGR02999 family)
MANEAPGQTLQPTALVHEAWLRLVGVEDRQFQNRAHFFAAAAEAMRRILVEKARRKQRAKHGGGQRLIDLSQVDVAAASDDETVLAVAVCSGQSCRLASR